MEVEPENIFMSVVNETNVSRDAIKSTSKDIVTTQEQRETSFSFAKGLRGITDEDLLSKDIEPFYLPNEEVTIKQKQIDKMTLELLVNKRQYRKYLEKHNTAEYEHKQDSFMQFCKYKKQIGMLMQDLLNDYSVSGNSVHLGNTEIQEIFEAFILKSTYFFESKEHESNSFGFSDDDEDTLFGSIVENDEPTEQNELSQTTIYSSGLYTAPFANQFRQGNSFWGKNVVKRK